jgi:hypothetical protein
MNTIEDRLRAATEAAANTVADFSQPPLRLPARAASYGRPRLRIAAPRLMASVATAVAIAAVATTFIAVRSGSDGSRPATGGAATSAGVPRFFAATVATKIASNQVIGATKVVIARTATGKVLATVRPPAPYNSFLVMSAAADDRTFVLAAQKISRSPQGPSQESGSTRLYLLRFHPGRRQPLSLRTLPIPVQKSDLYLSGIALSPSGTRLAVQSESPGQQSPSYLRVYDLADGRVRTWTLPPAGRSVSPGIISPSWDNGDRFLVFLVYNNKPRKCAAGCVQLLDTTRASGNILAASKTVLSTAAIHRYVSWSSVLVSPEGSRAVLVGMAGKRLGTGASDFTTPVVYDIAVPSGHILSHLTGQKDAELVPLWVGAGARLTILAQPRSDGTITAALYGPHGREPLRLPAGAAQAVW